MIGRLRVLGSAGTFTSLYLDGDHHPHISYSDETLGDLKFAYENAQGWHVETVDDAGDTGRYTSLALNADELLHIGYYDATHRSLKYAHWDGEGWLITTVDDGAWVGADGTPHIVGVTWRKR